MTIGILLFVKLWKERNFEADVIKRKRGRNVEWIRIKIKLN